MCRRRSAISRRAGSPGPSSTSGFPTCTRSGSRAGTSPTSAGIHPGDGPALRQRAGRPGDGSARRLDGPGGLSREANRLGPACRHLGAARAVLTPSRTGGDDMVEDTWNPWKMTAVGMMLVVATAVITGLVVAGWGPTDDTVASSSSAPARRAAPARAAHALPGRRRRVQPVREGAGGGQGHRGGEGRRGGGRRGRGGGRGRRRHRRRRQGGWQTVVSSAPTAGTLYGLNETKKNDARYVEAYRACMKGRGFSS